MPILGQSSEDSLQYPSEVNGALAPSAAAAQSETKAVGTASWSATTSQSSRAITSSSAACTESMATNTKSPSPDLQLSTDSTALSSDSKSDADEETKHAAPDPKAQTPFDHFITTEIPKKLKKAKKSGLGFTFLAFLTEAEKYCESDARRQARADLEKLNTAAAQYHQSLTALIQSNPALLKYPETATLLKHAKAETQLNQTLIQEEKFAIPMNFLNFLKGLQNDADFEEIQQGLIAADKATYFKDFLARRWKRICETDFSYNHNPHDPLNLICFEIAKQLAPALGTTPYALLMPNVDLQCGRGNIDTPIDGDESNPTLLPQYFVLSDPIPDEVKARLGIEKTDILYQPINVFECLAVYATTLNGNEDKERKDDDEDKTLAVFLRQSSQDGRELTADETNRVINHSKESHELYEATENYKKQKQNPRHLSNILWHLRDELREGSVQGSGKEKGTERQAGKPALNAVKAFKAFLSDLDPNIKNAIMGLRSADGVTFSQTWLDLDDPLDPLNLNRVGRRRQIPCVKLLGDELQRILNHEKDNPILSEILQKQALAKLAKEIRDKLDALEAAMKNSHLAVTPSYGEKGLTQLAQTSQPFLTRAFTKHDSLDKLVDIFYHKPVTFNTIKPKLLAGTKNPHLIDQLLMIAMWQNDQPVLHLPLIDDRSTRYAFFTECLQRFSPAPLSFFTKFPKEQFLFLLEWISQEHCYELLSHFDVETLEKIGGNEAGFHFFCQIAELLPEADKPKFWETYGKKYLDLLQERFVKEFLESKADNPALRVLTKDLKQLPPQVKQPILNALLNAPEFNQILPHAFLAYIQLLPTHDKHVLILKCVKNLSNENNLKNFAKILEEHGDLKYAILTLSVDECIQTLTEVLTIYCRQPLLSLNRLLEILSLTTSENRLAILRGLDIQARKTLGDLCQTNHDVTTLLVFFPTEHKLEFLALFDVAHIKQIAAQTSRFEFLNSICQSLREVDRSQFWDRYGEEEVSRLIETTNLQLSHAAMPQDEAQEMKHPDEMHPSFHLLPPTQKNHVLKAIRPMVSKLQINPEKLNAYLLQIPEELRRAVFFSYLKQLSNRFPLQLDIFPEEHRLSVLEAFIQQTQTVSDDFLHHHFLSETANQAFESNVFFKSFKPKTLTNDALIRCLYGFPKEHRYRAFNALIQKNRIVEPAKDGKKIKVYESFIPFHLTQDANEFWHWYHLFDLKDRVAFLKRVGIIHLKKMLQPQPTGVMQGELTNYDSTKLLWKIHAELDPSDRNKLMDLLEDHLEEILLDEIEYVAKTPRSPVELLGIEFMLFDNDGKASVNPDAVEFFASFSPFAKRLFVFKYLTEISNSGVQRQFIPLEELFSVRDLQMIFDRPKTFQYLFNAYSGEVTNNNPQYQTYRKFSLGILNKLGAPHLWHVFRKRKDFEAATEKVGYDVLNEVAGGFERFSCGTTDRFELSHFLSLKSQFQLWIPIVSIGIAALCGLITVIARVPNPVPLVGFIIFGLGLFVLICELIREVYNLHDFKTLTQSKIAEGNFEDGLADDPRPILPIRRDLDTADEMIRYTLEAQEAKHPDKTSKKRIFVPAYVNTKTAESLMQSGVCFWSNAEMMKEEKHAHAQNNAVTNVDGSPREPVVATPVSSASASAPPASSVDAPASFSQPLAVSSEASSVEMQPLGVSAPAP